MVFVAITLCGGVTGGVEFLELVLWWSLMSKMVLGPRTSYVSSRL